MQPSDPHLFDEYFASNFDESLSPFLQPSSRKWAKNLSLKGSLLSAFCLSLAFFFHFYSLPLSYFFLCFVYLLSGVPALLDSLEDLRKFKVNIDVLMTLAALLSVTIGSGLEGGLLLVLFELSGSMEALVTAKSSSALYALNGLAPQTARLKDAQGHIYEKASAHVKIGEECVIAAGEIIPLDGVVISGSSSLNLAHLTGESRPLAVFAGDEVHAGAANIDGSLVVKVTRTSSDSTINRIIKLIAKAQASKPKLQLFLDKFSEPYALTVILLSLFFALTLPLFFQMPFLSHEGSVYRALTFLIAASPCALIIATPTAYLSALSACARRGILLKGGRVLDALASVETVAFDKTGTLTTGELVCTQTKQLSGPFLPLDLATACAASLEQSSTHPIAKALTTIAKEKSLSLPVIEEFLSIAGFGLQGVVQLGSTKQKIFIGSKAFIEKQQEKKVAIEIEKEGEIVTLMLIGSSLFLFTFSDQLRSQLKNVVGKLKKEHKLHLTMLTGDHEINARYVASNVGLDSFYADLKPEDKFDRIVALRGQGALAMVGDGINDAPALAAATVGIAMGKIGSAAAIQEADVIFLQDDLTLLPWLLARSHKSMRIIKQNLSLALAVILLATTPALLGFIPLWLAVILHEGGTVLVGLNSLRLLSRK